MLILRNIRVWDTGEIIDMVIPSADARNQPEDGASSKVTSTPPG